MPFSQDKNGNVLESDFKIKRINGIYTIFNIGLNKSFLRPDHRYSYPETGLKHMCSPRAVKFLGGKTTILPGDEQYLLGMGVEKIPGGDIVPANALSEKSLTFLVHRDEKMFDVSGGNISVLQASPEIFMVTNCVIGIDNVESGDKLTFINGNLIRIEDVKFADFNKDTGETTTTDAEARALCKTFYIVVNSRHQEMTNKFIVSVVGQSSMPKKMLLIKGV